MSASIICKTLQKIKEDGKASYKDMASWAGVSPCTISLYVSGKRNIPEDIIQNIAIKGGLEELKIAYLTEKKLDVINTPLLNNIDDNIQTMIMRLNMEEIPEMIKALKDISKLTMNKKCLTEEESIDLEICAEQIADLLPAIKTFLIRLNKVYGLNIKKIDKKINYKLKMKGYVVDI